MVVLFKNYCMLNKAFGLIIALLFFCTSTFGEQKSTKNSFKPSYKHAQGLLFQDQNSFVIPFTLNELLIIYADSCNYEAVDFLLKNGANPNYCNNDGITALMYVSDKGNYKIAKLLLEHGADVNAKPYDGNTAIFAAVRSNNDSIAELLILNKAEINIENASGLTPLHYAVGYGYPAMTELLIYYGTDTNLQDSKGNTPLMASVYSGAIEVTKMLIKAGADVNKKDYTGNTPVMTAAQFNDTLLIRTMFNAGASLNEINRYNSNALSFAVRNNSIDAFKLLVDLGANIDGLNLKKSFYQQACENGYMELAAIIKNKGFNSKLKANIGSINFYTGFSTSNYDFMIDLGGGIYESISRTMVNIGYKYRPFSARVIEYRNSEFYQFWEKRYAIYLSVQHLIKLKNSGIYKAYGIVPGISNEFTWSYYRGLDKGSGLKVYLVPSLGLYYKSELFAVIGKWEIANYNKEAKSFNRFNLQFIVTIPSFSNTFKNKKIGWLD